MRERRKPVNRAEGGLRVNGRFSARSEEGRPLVSVVTVCLNSEKYLEETIESVLGQTYEKIEYIIVDGGSGDGTLDIIRRYQDRIAYWLSEPDGGIFDAMNKGISLSTGELVGLINSDDRYFPYTVEEVVRVSGEDPGAQVYYGSMHIIDREGRFY